MSLVLGIAAMGSLTPAAHAASASPAVWNADCSTTGNSGLDYTFTGEVGDTFQIVNTSTTNSCLFKPTTGVSGSFGAFEGYNGVASPTGLVTAGDVGYIGNSGTDAATFTIVASGTFTIGVNISGTDYHSTITVVVPTSSQTSTPAAPAPQTVTFQTPLGAACSMATDSSGNPFSSSVTVTPQWVSVPTCTREGSTFLGWSTSPIFPVSVAQEQVAARYGAWDGTAYGMRMIFIPHYWHTYISGDNTLYGVWG